MRLGVEFLDVWVDVRGDEQGRVTMEKKKQRQTCTYLQRRCTRSRSRKE